jgi:D-methionine transport system ATP-binding protein
MIDLNDIVVTFEGHGRKVEAVRGVSLHVEKGEIFGIVGTSGAGKSTLLRTINLLERPTSGSVHINGRDITNLSGDELRRERLRIGMIFQHFNLAGSRTVFDNIALPLHAAGLEKRKIDHRVRDLLELVELSDKEHAYPGQLSGGQKQRVGIARALANESEILLCDEPTSALDLETSVSILELLADINRRLGITIVIISHEMNVIKRICRRVAVMKDGRVVEENDVYSLFATPREEFTRQLVAQSLNLALSPRVLAETRGRIFRIVYLGDRAEEPVISHAVRSHDVTINILHGKIEYINDKPVGVLSIAISGEDSWVEDTIEYISHNVAVIEEIKK